MVFALGNDMLLSISDDDYVYYAFYKFPIFTKIIL